MSPPIRDGSGNSIGGIRLGDGSEISEVRTGAGDVLFSAIPDSGLSHDYHADAQNLDGENVVDQAGSNDLSGNYTTGQINGVDAFAFDGTDDDVSGSAANYTSEYTIHLVYLPDATENTTVLETGGSVRVEGVNGNRAVTHSGKVTFEDGAYQAVAEILSIRYGSTHSSTPDYAVNGSSVSLGDSGGLQSPSGIMHLGGGAQGQFNGGVGRVVIYNQEQSDSDFNQTINALGGDFGITT